MAVVNKQKLGFDTRVLKCCVKQLLPPIRARGLCGSLDCRQQACNSSSAVGVHVQQCMHTTQPLELQKIKVLSVVCLATTICVKSELDISLILF